MDFIFCIFLWIYSKKKKKWDTLWPNVFHLCFEKFISGWLASLATYIDCQTQCFIRHAKRFPIPDHFQIWSQVGSINSHGLTFILSSLLYSLDTKLGNIVTYSKNPSTLLFILDSMYKYRNSPSLNCLVATTWTFPPNTKHTQYVLL